MALAINSFDQIYNRQPTLAPFDLQLSRRELKIGQLADLVHWMNGRDVEVLDLAGTQIDDGGIQILSSAIKAQRNLKTLYLSDNKIGDAGAEILADALRQSSIRYCTFHHNRIGPVGAEALAKAVADSGQMSRLDFSSNRLGDEGALRVAQALRREKGNIGTLRLLNNQISMIGDRSLAENLPKSIDVTYRSERITIQQYYERHPWFAMGLLVFLPPVFILTALCRPHIDEPVFGTRNERTGP